MRIIKTLRTYYTLYLSEPKQWILAVGGLPILMLVLLFDLIADSKLLLTKIMDLFLKLIENELIR